MKNKLNKALSLLLVVAMLLSLMPAGATEEVGPGIGGGSTDTPTEDANNMTINEDNTWFRITKDGKLEFSLDIQPGGIPDAGFDILIQVVGDNSIAIYPGDYKSLWAAGDDNVSHPNSASNANIAGRVKDAFMPVWVYRIKVTKDAEMPITSATGVTAGGIVDGFAAGQLFETWADVLEKKPTSGTATIPPDEAITYKAIVGSSVSISNTSSLRQDFDVTVLTGAPELTGETDIASEEQIDNILADASDVPIAYFIGSPDDYGMAPNVTLTNIGGATATITGLSFVDADGLVVSEAKISEESAIKEEDTISHEEGNNTGIVTVDLSGFYDDENGVTIDGYTEIYLKVEYSNSGSAMTPLLVMIPIVPEEAAVLSPDIVEFYVVAGEEIIYDAYIADAIGNINEFSSAEINVSKVENQKGEERTLGAEGKEDEEDDTVTLITFTYDAVDDAPGDTITADCTVSYDGYEDTISVVIHVIGEAELSANPDALNFGELTDESANTISDGITLTATGSGNIYITSIETSDGVNITSSNATVDNTTVAAGSSVTLSYTGIVSSADSASDMITIYYTDDNPNDTEEPLKIPVTLDATTGLLAGDGITIEVPKGSTKDGTLELKNVGGSAAGGAFSYFFGGDRPFSSFSANDPNTYYTEFSDLQSGSLKLSGSGYASGSIARDATVSMTLTADATGAEVGDTATYDVFVTYGNGRTLHQIITVKVVAAGETTTSYTLMGDSVDTDGATVTVGTSIGNVGENSVTVDSTADDTTVYFKVIIADDYTTPISYAITKGGSSFTPSVSGPDGSGVYSFTVPKSNTDPIVITASATRKPFEGTVTVNLNGSNSWGIDGNPAFSTAGTVTLSNGTGAVYATSTSDNVHTFANLTYGETYNVLVDGTDTGLDITAGATTKTVNYITVSESGDSNVDTTLTYGGSAASGESVVVLTNVSGGASVSVSGAVASSAAGTVKFTGYTATNCTPTSLGTSGTITITEGSDDAVVLTPITATLYSASLEVRLNNVQLSKGTNVDDINSTTVTAISATGGTLAYDSTNNKWYVAGLETGQSAKFTVTAVGDHNTGTKSFDVTVNAGASGTLKLYTVSLGTLANGSATIANGTGPVVWKVGESVAVTATPATDFEFDAWTVSPDNAGSVSGGSYTVPEASGAITLTPTFKAKTNNFTFTVNVNGKTPDAGVITAASYGSTTITSTSGVYTIENLPYGSHTFSITTKDGATHTKAVTVDASTNSDELNLYTVTVKPSDYVTETGYTEVPFVRASGTTVAYVKVGDSVSVNEGTLVADSIYTHNGWDNAGVTGSSGSYSFTYPSNDTDGVTLTPTYTYTAKVTVNVDGNGKPANDVTVGLNSSGSDTVTSGTATSGDNEVEFSGLIPGNTYTVVVPSYVGGSDTVITTKTFTHAAAAATVDYYTVSIGAVTVNSYDTTEKTLKVDGNMETLATDPTITVTLSDQTDVADKAVLAGTNVTYTLSSYTGYDYTHKWDDNATTQTTTKAVTNGVTASATLTQNTYTATVYAYGTGALDVVTVQKTDDPTATFEVLLSTADDVSANTDSFGKVVGTFKTVSGEHSVTVATPVSGTNIDRYQDVDNNSPGSKADGSFDVNSLNDGVQIKLKTVETTLTANDNKVESTKVIANMQSDNSSEALNYSTSHTYGDTATSETITITLASSTGAISELTAEETSDASNIAEGTPAWSGGLAASSSTTYNITITPPTTAGTYTATYTFTFKDASGTAAAESITYTIEYTVSKSPLKTVTISPINDDLEVNSVTAEYGNPSEEAGEDVTYQWYTADSADGDGTAIASANDKTLSNCENYAGKWVYVVATAKDGGNYSGEKESNRYAVPYTAEITVNLDGSASADAPAPRVYTKSDGTGDVSVNRIGDGTYTFSADPGKDYYVFAPVSSVSGAGTKNVATITDVDNKSVTIDYWTVKGGTLTVKHAATDGKAYTTTESQASGITWSLINPSSGADNLSLDDPRESNCAVLEGEKVTYAAPATLAGFDYTLAWESGNGTITVDKNSTTAAATLTQNTYPVTFTANAEAVTSVVASKSGTVASWTGSAVKEGTLEPELPIGKYTATVSAPNYVITSIEDFNDSSNTTTNSATCDFEVKKVEGTTTKNGVKITLEKSTSALTLKDGDDKTESTFTATYGNLSVNKTLPLTLTNGGNTTLSGHLVIKKGTAEIYNSATPGDTIDAAETDLIILDNGSFTNLAGSSALIPPMQVTIPTTLEVEDSAQYTFTYTANGGQPSATYTLTIKIEPDKLTAVTTDKGGTAVLASDEITVSELTAAISDNHPEVDDDATYQWYYNSTQSNVGGTPIDGATKKNFTPTGYAGKYVYVAATGKGNYDPNVTVYSAPIPVMYDATITVMVDGVKATDNSYETLVQLRGDDGSSPSLTFDDDTDTYKATGLMPGSYDVYAKAYSSAATYTDTDVDVTVDDPTATVQYWTVETKNVTVVHFDHNGDTTDGDLGTLKGYTTTISATANTVLDNTYVTFTPTPWTGHDYSIQWQSKETSDDDYTNVSGTAESYGVKITEPTTVTATLTQNTYPVTVYVKGTGTVTSFNLDQTGQPPVEDASVSSTAVTVSNGEKTATLNHAKLPNGTYSVEDLNIGVGTQLLGYSTDGGAADPDANTVTINKAEGKIYIHVAQPTLKLTVSDGTNSGESSYTPGTTPTVKPATIATAAVEVVYGTTDPVEVVLTLTNTGDGTLFDVTGVAGSSNADGHSVDTEAPLPDGEDMAKGGEPYTVELNFNPLNKNVGTYTATYTFDFAANDGGNKTNATVTYTFTVKVVPATVTDLFVTLPTAPEVGANPTVDTTVYPDNGNGTQSGYYEGVNVGSDMTTADVTSVTWTPTVTTTFAAGTTYTAEVVIKLTDTTNYKFGATDEIKAKYVDGAPTDVTVAVKSVTDDTLTLTYTYPATAPAAPKVVAEGGSANGPTGTITSISVKTPKDVKFYWVVANADVDFGSNDVKNPDSDNPRIVAHGNSGTNAYYTPDGATGIAEWTNSAALSAPLEPGTTYYVYAVAVYKDDETKISAVGNTEFKTWHKVIVTAEGGTVITPAENTESAHIVYVAPYSDSHTNDSTTVKAAPNAYYGDIEWTVDGNPVVNGTFADNSLEETTFTVAENASGTINVKAVFQGKSDIEWQTTSIADSTLPKGYAENVTVHSNVLENLGVAPTGEVVVTVTYKKTADSGDPADASTYLTIDPRWITDGNQTLAPYGSDVGSTQTFTLTTTGTQLDPGEYTVYLTATNAKDDTDVEVVSFKLKVSESAVALNPNVAEWDINAANKANPFNTSTGTKLDKWEVNVLGNDAVDSIDPITIETVSLTNAYDSSAGKITIPATELSTEFADKKVGDPDIVSDVTINLIAGGTVDPKPTLTIKFVDTTPIVYKVALNQETIVNVGTKLTATVTTVVDRDWPFSGKYSDITPEGAEAQLGSTDGICVDWYTSTDGTNWTHVQGPNKGSETHTNESNSFDFNVTDDYMGYRIMVVVSDNSTDTTYRGETLSTIAEHEAQLTDTATTAFRVEAIVSTDVAKNGGSITAPTATGGKHVAYVTTGNVAAITAQPYDGYVFDGWTLDTVGSGTFAYASAASTTFTPTANSTVVANFKPATITVTSTDHLASIVYNTTPTDVLVDIDASTDGHNDSVTYAITGASYNGVTDTDGIGQYFTIDPDGKITARMTMDKNVIGSAYDTAESTDGEIKLTITVSSTKLGTSTQTVEVTIDILSNQLTITGTPNYPDVMSGDAFDADKLSHLVVKEQGGTTVAQDDYTWSMTPSTFTASGNYTFTATHDQNSVTDTKWNYIPATVTDDITVTAVDAQLVFTDKLDGDYGTPAVNYVNTDESITYGAALPTYTVKLTNSGNVNLYDVDITVKSGAENFTVSKLPINDKDYAKDAFEEFTVALKTNAVETYTIEIEAVGNTGAGGTGTEVTATYTLTVEVEQVSTNVTINVTAPAAGGTPTNGYEPAADSEKYDVTDTKWYVSTNGTTWTPMDPETDRFEKGKQYKAEFTVVPNPGYTLPNDKTGYTVNDGTPAQPDSVTDGDAEGKIVTATWSIPAGTTPPTPGPSTPTPSTPKYEITYNPGPNGESDDPLTEEVKEGEKPKNVPEITPKDEEYVFIGWITEDPETLDPDEEITTINPEDVTITGPTEFFAVVTKKEIKVNYELGSFGTTTDETLEIVAKYSYPSFTPEVSIIESQKDLATFVGWSLEKPDHVLEVKLVDPLKMQILKDTTFYAVYEITEYEYHEHYMIGYPNGNFEPNKDITRAEVATIIARAILPDFIEGSWYGTGGYTDMYEGSHWALSAIAFVTEAGIFEGYEDGTFRPNQPITRQEYATVIARLKGLLDGDRADLAQFADYDEVSEWAIDGVYTCATEGWIEGYEDDSFRPKQDITRAEAAKMMNGYLNRGVDEPGVSTVPEYIQFPDVYQGHWAYWHVAEAVNDHYYYYYYVDVDGNDTPPEQWVIEAGYLNVKLDDNDPDNTKNVRRSDPIYVNSISAGTSTANP